MENECGICGNFKSAFLNFQNKSVSENNISNELGNRTWFFLHTMAAYYPDNPSELQKQKMLLFIDGLSEFYPCKTCSEHLKEHIIQMPPNVETNKTLSEWFCKIHNNINKNNGKEQFDCSNVIKEYKHI